MNEGQGLPRSEGRCPAQWHSVVCFAAADSLDPRTCGKQGVCRIAPSLAILISLPLLRRWPPLEGPWEQGQCPAPGDAKNRHGWRYTYQRCVLVDMVISSRTEPACRRQDSQRSTVAVPRRDDLHRYRPHTLLPIYLVAFSTTFGGVGGLSDKQLGLIGSVFFAGLIVAMLVTGPAADRLGAKSVRAAGPRAGGRGAADAGGGTNVPGPAAGGLPSWGWGRASWT